MFLFIFLFHINYDLLFLYGYILCKLFSGYDLSSPEYSTWTESVWHEVHIRIFLRQSLKLQIIIFGLGIVIFLLSFIIVKKMNDQSGIHFNNQE